ncbi:MAG TPA: nucleotidyltransferase domain-containing protein [Acidimicrobiales bacterium]
MDFLRPVESVIPGAQGKLLGVFAETTTVLSVRTAARLSGVSLAQTSRILPELATLGILDRADVPPSTVYRLVEDNVASRAIRLLARSRDLVLAELGKSAQSMAIPPISIVVFGSFARGEAGPESDVDVVMVHPSGVPSTPAWTEGVEEWRRAARRLTGNEVEVVEVDERDIGTRLRSRRPVWLDIRQDGIVIFGKTLDVMRARESKIHHVA